MQSIIKHSGAFAVVLAVLAAGDLAAQEEQGEKGVSEETMVIRGRAQELYRVVEVDTGKLTSDPLSSAHIVTSINAALIRDQGARDAQDIYRNISGVSLFSYAGVTARGFRQEEIFFDGLRGDPYVGFNVPQLFNIERVDFLKGPAGMLYGPGAPGGLFNYVTKKPTEEFYSRVTGVYGQEARRGGSYEVNGALPVEGSAGRFGIFYEDRNTPRWNTASETIIYDGGIAKDFDFARLTLQATRYEQNQQGNRLRGVIVDAGGDFITDRRWNHNEASDFLDLESNNLQAKLEGQVSESIEWDITVRQTDSEQAQKYHEPIQLIDVEALADLPTDGTPDFVARQFRDQLREEEQFSFGVNIIWSQHLGSIENRLLAGYEFFDGEESALLGRLNSNQDMVARFLAGASLPGDIIPLSISAPVYGVTQPENYAVQFGAPRMTEQRRSGAYLLNESTLGKFTAVAGVRFDDFEDVSGDDSFEDDNTSLRFGLIYKPREDISIFGQWAESYEPQSIGNQRAEAGGPFEPTTGTIVELGVKTELMDGRIQTSAAVYEIIRENILQSDPLGDPEDDGINNFVSFGEVTSQGFEFDISADITPDWVLTASYGYNNAKITEDADTSTIRNSFGDRFANAPEHQFGFWTRYQVSAMNTAFAFGGDYVSERINLNGRDVPSFTIFDASIIWEPGPVDVLLRIDNVFDETYAASGFLTRTGHFPGDPRSVFVEISKAW